MPRLSDEKYQQIVDDYNSGMTQKAVGKKNGIGRDAVGNILSRLGIPIREYTGSRNMSSRKIFWDFDFFTRQNKVVAYWAGFLMADGHIHVGPTGGSSLISYVNIKDTEHMRRFCKDIGNSDELRFRKDGYVGFHLNYSELSKHLKVWGIIPNKTTKFLVPEFNSDLLPHYLRGWIDGDGHVYRYGRSSRITIASGNKESMEWFANALRVVGYLGNIGIRPVKAYPGNWILYIGGRNQVERVCELLLVDSEYCMDRKWKDSYHA